MTAILDRSSALTMPICPSASTTTELVPERAVDLGLAVADVGNALGFGRWRTQIIIVRRESWLTRSHLDRRWCLEPGTSVAHSRNAVSRGTSTSRAWVAPSAGFLCRPARLPRRNPASPETATDATPGRIRRVPIPRRPHRSGRIAPLIHLAVDGGCAKAAASSISPSPFVNLRHVGDAMTTTLEPPISTPLPPTLDRMNANAVTTADDSAVTPMSRQVGKIGLLGLRLAIGFEFLWAFLDKTFGLGYHTANAEGLDPRRLTDHGLPVRRACRTVARHVPFACRRDCRRLAVHARAPRGRRRAHPRRCPAPRRDFGLRDVGDDVRRELAVRQDQRRSTDRVDESDRRRPHRQLRGAHRDRRVRRTQCRHAQPTLVCTRSRAGACVAPITVGHPRHLEVRCRDHRGEEPELEHRSP